MAKKILLVVVIVLGCQVVWPDSAVAERQGSVVARGRALTIELLPMPEPFQDYSAGILDLFAASADSSFRYGPIMPNPHSWLSPSVILRDTTGFAVDFLSAAGDSGETLHLSEIPPGFYRIRFWRLEVPDSGLQRLRFRHDGAVVHEGRFSFSDTR